jgi:hypothetical protein
VAGLPRLHEPALEVQEQLVGRHPAAAQRVPHLREESTALRYKSL